MTFQTNSVDKNGLARTPDGKLYVTFGSGSQIAQVIAKSLVAVSCPADVSEDILATITVPAGAIGANGVMRVVAFWSFTNDANNKTLRIRYSGIGGTTYYTQTLTTQQVATADVYIGNRNAANSQGGWFNQTKGDGSTSISTLSTSAIDTTAQTTIVITGQKALAGNALTLEGYLVELMYGA